MILRIVEGCVLFVFVVIAVVGYSCLIISGRCSRDEERRTNA